MLRFPLFTTDYYPIVLVRYNLVFFALLFSWHEESMKFPFRRQTIKCTVNFFFVHCFYCFCINIFSVIVLKCQITFVFISKLKFEKKRHQNGSISLRNGDRENEIRIMENWRKRTWKIMRERQREAGWNSEHILEDFNDVKRLLTLKQIIPNATQIVMLELECLLILLQRFFCLMCKRLKTIKCIYKTNRIRYVRARMKKTGI